MAKFKKGFPMRKRSLLVVLIALAVVITAQPVLAGQSHWVKVVNILLEKQKWIGQGQELYSYTMHDAEKWSTATWTCGCNGWPAMRLAPGKQSIGSYSTMTIRTFISESSKPGLGITIAPAKYICSVNPPGSSRRAGQD